MRRVIRQSNSQKQLDTEAVQATAPAARTAPRPGPSHLLTAALLAAVGLSIATTGCRDQKGDGQPASRAHTGKRDRPHANKTVYVFDDGVKIARDGRIFTHVSLDDYEERNPAWDGKMIRLGGARGETVAFQIVFRAGPEALPAVDVQLSALRQLPSIQDSGPDRRPTIDAGQFARFRQWYVKVTRPSTSPRQSTGPGEYPDALIPADVPEHGLPVSVAANQWQGVWIDLTIPRDAAPATYRGTAIARSRDTELAHFDVTLEVYNFGLPKQRHLRWRVGYGGFGDSLNEYENIGYHPVCGKESAAFRAREAQLYRLAWSHRLAPTTHYSTPFPTHSGTGANLRIDWSTFDRRFAGYLNGSAFASGVPLDMFSLPVNLHSSGGWPSGTRQKLDDLDTAAITTAVAQTARHWRDRGWPIKNTFIYASDEPGADRYEVLDAACKAIRRGNRDVPISIAFYTEFGDHAAELVKRFTGCVTMWDIAGDYMNLPALAGRQAAGDTVGFYQGSEPFQGSEALDADGLSLTTWPWIAWRYRLDTLFLYNMVEWSYFRLNKRTVPWRDLPRDIWINPLNQSWQTNSQGVLVYPGHRIGYKGVIPSIRLKQVRRGMQDYEYLWLLAQKGHRTQADAVARQIIPKALHEAAAGWGGPHHGLGSWQRDPRRWAEARRKLARAITQ
ncbi:MAG: DUF4091 domain-containing protein [Proteobacteria bacterium]|nr:DUF4091 domain-containing protein [Pseudomonadota bacterium]